MNTTPWTTTLRARFDGTALVPLDPIDLPVGAEVDIEVRERADPPAGSPVALLRAMDGLPHPQPGDVDALARAIAAGQSPVRAAGIFDDADDDRGLARP